VAKAALTLEQDFGYTIEEIPGSVRSYAPPDVDEGAKKIRLIAPFANALRSLRAGEDQLGLMPEIGERQLAYASLLDAIQLGVDIGGIAHAQEAALGMPRSGDTALDAAEAQVAAEQLRQDLLAPLLGTPAEDLAAAALPPPQIREAPPPSPATGLGMV